MTRARHVFHVGGGAAAGGKTLTARSDDPETAVREANRHFRPRRTYGPGMWTPRPNSEMFPATDDDGNPYYHADWVLESAR